MIVQCIFCNATTVMRINYFPSLFLEFFQFMLLADRRRSFPIISFTSGLIRFGGMPKIRPGCSLMLDRIFFHFSTRIFTSCTRVCVSSRGFCCRVFASEAWRMFHAGMRNTRAINYPRLGNFCSYGEGDAFRQPYKPPTHSRPSPPRLLRTDFSR